MPSRLIMRVHADGETHAVQTNLVGEHCINSVMAALLTALCCGIDLKAAISAVEQVQPFYGRMQPVLLPSGAIMIRDEYNCAFATLEAALRAFAKFQAARRVLVVSGFSDSAKNSVARFRELGKMASEVGDLAIFISKHHGHHAVKAAIAAGMKPGCALSFADLFEAANYLKLELRGGDLVLLKGRTTDHLSRLFLAQFGAISCWKTQCSKRIMCDYCAELGPEFDLQSIGMR